MRTSPSTTASASGSPVSNDVAGAAHLAQAIIDLGRAQSVTMGEFLFTEGEPPGHVYAVVDGCIHIVRALRSGRQLLLGAKYPMDAFGELSAIDGAPRAASALASEPSRVVRMTASRFRTLLAEQPELSHAVTRNLAAQLRETNERLCARNSENTLVRAGHQVVELATLVVKHGSSVPGEPIELAITQRDLAEWIGATREATARALSTLRRSGAVETHRGRIVVHDVHLLAGVVSAAATSS